MGRGLAGLVVALTLLATVTASAAAQGPAGSPFAPWDGRNPFNCENQNVGQGTDFPHPEADPFCVEFDKTNQNLAGLGIVDFASQEPTRVDAAATKCFYYQHDHWTGSLVQGEPPELYHFDGSYFFNKATGEGGVHIDNFRVGGQPTDPGPFVPDEYKPYFTPTGGGALLENNVPADPTCAAKVNTQQEQAQIYRHCQPESWTVDGGGVGDVGIRDRRSNILRRLGPPSRRRHATDRFCVTGGGEVRVLYRGKGRRVLIAKTTSPAHSAGGVHPGSSGSAARRALHARVLLGTRRNGVFAARHRKLLIGVHGGKVTYLAATNPRRPPRARGLRRALRRLR